jgi:hypothetical protein
MESVSTRRYKLTVGNMFSFLLISYAIYNFVDPGFEPFGYIIGLVSLFSAFFLLGIDFYLQIRIKSLALINVVDLIISILIFCYLAQ